MRRRLPKVPPLKGPGEPGFLGGSRRWQGFDGWFGRADHLGRADGQEARVCRACRRGTGKCARKTWSCGEWPPCTGGDRPLYILGTQPNGL